MDYVEIDTLNYHPYGAVGLKMRPRLRSGEAPRHGTQCGVRIISRRGRSDRAKNHRRQPGAVSR